MPPSSVLWKPGRARCGPSFLYARRDQAVSRKPRSRRALSPALRALAARPRLLLALGALLVILGQIVFVRSEAETPPGGGVFLLALGWALFALGSFARGGGEEETWTDVSSCRAGIERVRRRG